MVVHRDQPADGGAFQFHLRHLFLLLALNCLFFALVRSAGEFLATLVIGTFFLAASIVLFRIENMLQGAIVGTCAAGVILVGAALAFHPVPSECIVVGCLVYPVIGYTLGIICAADRQVRSG